MSKQIRVELQDWTLNGDLAIASAAWTSSSTLEQKTSRTEEDVERLIKMLAKNRHSTPFEMVNLRFWLRLPIQTDRQLMTHRAQSSSGMSGRYRTMPSEFLETPEDVTKILVKGLGTLYENDAIAYNAIKQYNIQCAQSNAWYKDLLKQAKQAETLGLITNPEYKRIREFYRGVLPQNNMTERVSMMNLRFFSNFMKLRNSPHAQEEIQEIARQMLEQVKEKNVAPVAIACLEKYEWEI